MYATPDFCGSENRNDVNNIKNNEKVCSTDEIVHCKTEKVVVPEATKTFRVFPPYSEVSEFIGRLEALAEACGIGRARGEIRTVKMVFLRAYAEIPQEQVDMRMLVSSDKEKAQCTTAYLHSMGLCVGCASFASLCTVQSWNTTCNCSTYVDLVFLGNLEGNNTVIKL